MYWFKNIYNNLFLGFLISIVIVFFYSRPLNSPFHRIISGDGFGYYAYLPAKYIYNDSQYEFKWFNDVYTKNYSVQNYKSADDNFLIPYKSRRVNKYYPGVSLLWLPFFIGAHFLAEVNGFAADGYSQPYQLAIALASLFYLLLGLFYIRKLLLKMFNNEFTALITPVLLYYGTYLFSYSININSLSHIYSFAFITMLLYFSWNYFNQINSVKYLLLSLLCICIVFCIRPINILSVLIIPAFIPADFFKKKFKFNEFTFGHLALILLMILFVYNQFSIQYSQTGSFFANTYSNEKFYFDKPRLFDVLFSYHAGLFVYAPLVFISLFGTFFVRPFKKAIILLSVLFLVIYIYSSWWYWSITNRTLIDYYVIIGILLAALINQVQTYTLKISMLFVMIGTVLFYQLKNYQLEKGILDSYHTYKELFWKNLFRTKKINQCVIPPATIIKQSTIDFNYEGECNDTLKRLTHSGNCSGMLDSVQKFSRPFTYKIPAHFYESGVKKIRISFWTYFKPEVKSCPVYMYFYDKDNAEMGVTAFFINETIEYNVWDKKEFGWELTDKDLANGRIDHVTWFINNNELKDRMYVDDVKTEFILTDRSYEIVE